ncbi:MAG: SDR family NAD(P)-dependent oxidoreductase [Halothermotrichaceae bacterium]
MISIAGKWALVTGSSRGIGREIARALAERRCNIVLHSRSKEHTRKIEEELKKEGLKVFSLEADLAVPEAAEKMALKAEELTGGIDILYNNAAVQGKWREDFRTPVEEYQLLFNVNIISPIKICDIILPRMKERGFGRIINVSSGIQDQPELTPYAISKAAVDKYVEDMAVKLEGKNVLMNLLDPGWIRTDLGGPDAPNSVESVIPGALVPALLEKDEGSGQFFRAQEYNN